MTLSITEDFTTIEMQTRIKVALVPFADSDRVSISVNQIPVVLIYPQDVDKLIGMLQAVKKRAGK